MKKILLILSLTIIVISCDKWLDVTSSTDISSDNEFQTEAGFRDALIGIYAHMTHENNYGKNKTWYLIDLVCQPYQILGVSVALQENSIQTRKYKDLKVRTIIDAMWKESYTTIANINNALKYIEIRKNILNPINYSLIKGELLALRAFIHFDLMREFGYGNLGSNPVFLSKLAIPYIVDYSKEITAQRSHHETIVLMLDDIENAIKLLSEVDPILRKHPLTYYSEVNIDGFYNNRQRRMNYYAVQALKARICLWEGSDVNKTKALTAAKEVISAIPSVFQWITESEVTAPIDSRNLTFIQEHIFALDVQSLENRSFATVVNSAFNSLSNIYTAQTISSKNTAALYENIASDYRFTYITREEGNNKTPVKLYQMQNEKVRKYWNIIPLIKISEMYYIAAECDPENALSYLNVVRRHRGITTDLVSSANVSKEIEKEYRKEFICEGQLFYYYKRLGVVTLPAPSTTSATMDNNTYMLPYPDKEIMYGNRVQF